MQNIKFPMVPTFPFSGFLSENKCRFKRKPFRKNIYEDTIRRYPPLHVPTLFNFRTRRFYYFLFTVFISLFSIPLTQTLVVFKKSSTYSLESAMQHVFLISLLYHLIPRRSNFFSAEFSFGRLKC